MKKSMIVSSLLLVGFIMGGHQAFAATSDTKTQSATVSLTESTDPNSLLQITSASDLNFGAQAIGVSDMKFTDANSPSIVITDIRGEAPGWNVSVSLGEFTDSTNNQTLTGVQLFYPTVSMTTTSTAISVDDRRPSTIATDSSFSDSTIKGLLLDSQASPTSKTLINAAAKKGNGQWTATYDTSNKVELLVPAGNLAGNYSANLTYTLADGPAS